MATATLGLINYTEINDADSATDWTEFTTPDADVKKEGLNALSGVLRADGEHGWYLAGSPISCAGQHLRMWVNTTNLPYMEDTAGGGYQMSVYDSTNTDYYTIFSSDDYGGGWFNAVVDCALFTTVTPANVIRWGIYANHTTNAKNVINTWVDYFRYMDGYYITGGTSGDKVRLSDVAIADKGTTTLYGYGIVEEYEDTYFSSGEIQIGNGATTTYFEMDGDVLVFTDKPVADGLYKLTADGAGCNLTIKDSTIKASGSGDDNRPDIDMVTGSPNSVSITGSVVNRAGTCSFMSGQTITNNIFNNCEQIIPSGAAMVGSTVKGYEGTTGTGALFYGINADPDGELDAMSFSMGTALTHAIEFGISAPPEMTLRDIDFSGYHVSGAQNDSTLYFPDKGTDTTWTVNLVGCTGNISYTQARGGDTVDLVIDPVTTEITVRDITTASGIQGARVLAWVTDNANWFYNASVGITGTGTTATVAHNSHGLSTGDNIIIEGANEDVYNGAYTITVTGVDEYEYTTNETIGTSPATGTITSTFAILNGTTDAAGEISDTRSFSFNQPILGRVRKATAPPPYYQAGPITGEIDKESGFSLIVQLIQDE
ncbi:hypothetical protein AYK24_00275 [Thermoplasmatales archaeon SG8-52-4]|nr:MAG: hypothetical protein AYK24_00275 [Thermoplasmatales archaeon SG8-52-4]